MRSLRLMRMIAIDDSSVKVPQVCQAGWIKKGQQAIGRIYMSAFQQPWHELALAIRGTAALFVAFPCPGSSL